MIAMMSSDAGLKRDVVEGQFEDPDEDVSKPKRPRKATESPKTAPPPKPHPPTPQLVPPVSQQTTAPRPVPPYPVAINPPLMFPNASTSSVTVQQSGVVQPSDTAVTVLQHESIAATRPPLVHIPSAGMVVPPPWAYSCYMPYLVPQFVYPPYMQQPPPSQQSQEKEQTSLASHSQQKRELAQKQISAKSRKASETFADNDDWHPPYSHNFHPLKGFFRDNESKSCSDGQENPEESNPALSSKKKKLATPPVKPIVQGVVASCTPMTKKWVPTVFDPVSKIPPSIRDENFPSVEEDKDRKFGILEEELTDKDVLCGRGGLTNFHPGNKWYRKICLKHRNSYAMAQKPYKSKIAKEIVLMVRGEHGRFLRKHNDSFYWYEAGDEAALQKTSQTLREGLAKLYRQGLATSGLAAVPSEEDEEEDASNEEKETTAGESSNQKESTARVGLI